MFSFLLELDTYIIAFSLELLEVLISYSLFFGIETRFLILKDLSMASSYNPKFNIDMRLSLEQHLASTRGSPAWSSRAGREKREERGWFLNKNLQFLSQMSWFESKSSKLGIQVGKVGSRHKLRN